MVLYECHVKDSSVWFDHHAGATGEACYSPNMPPEWTFCLATNAWAWVSIRSHERVNKSLPYFLLKNKVRGH